MDEVIVYSVYLPFLLSALLGLLFIPRVLILSHRKRLFDIPDERKTHDSPVPRLGGITFLPILLMCVCLVTGIWVNKGAFPVLIAPYVGHSFCAAFRGYDDALSGRCG